MKRVRGKTRVRQVFWMTPATGPGFHLLLGIIIAINAALIAVFVWFGISARRTRFEVTGAGLRIHAAMYGRTIPGSVLEVDRARHVDMRQEPELRLALRTNGIGLPGYGAGWFRLKNGAKALAFLTDQRSVVYLPTREGYSLLLSVAEPEAFLDAIQRLR